MTSAESISKRGEKNVVKHTGLTSFQLLDGRKGKCLAQVFKFKSKSRLRSIHCMSSMLYICIVFISKGLHHACNSCF